MTYTSRCHPPLTMLSTVVRRTCRFSNVLKASSRAFSYPAHDLVGMPALSPTMEMGTIAKWNYGVGDKVNAGDSVADIETDKASMAFEAQDEVCTIHYTLYTLPTIHYTLYTLPTIHYTLYTIHSPHYTVLYCQDSFGSWR